MADARKNPTHGMTRRSAVFLLLAVLTGCVADPAISPGDTSTRESVASQRVIQTIIQASPSNNPPATVAATPNPIQASPEATQAGATTLAADAAVTLAFVGDIMLGRSLAARIGRDEGNSIFASVEPVVQSADLAIGNLECALGEGGTPALKAYTFLAPPQAAGLLANAGFDLMTLANNHSLDFGREVFGQTQALLSQNGIRYVGAGSEESDANAPARFEIDGVRIAFLAYADVVPEYLSKFDTRIWTAGPSIPGIAWADDGRIKRDLESLEGSADLIVVLFHFGTEGVALPDKRQVQLSRLAVDSGADLVIGTHPHVIQSVEQYDDGWIFYSLGNFVFDQFEGISNKSAILWISVTSGEKISYSLMPLVIVDGIPRIGE
jgi:poly-gamma-glutamate capsule biosynthesis protein CapA/YwtB (metallophosphatase superfamily)